MPDTIDDIKNALASCLQALQGQGYISEEEMQAQLRNIQRDKIVTIPLYNKPDPTCQVCGTVHGEYRDVDHALDIIAGANRDECKKEARHWLTERIDREKETQREGNHDN